jgi:hypothetical protein
MKDQTEEIENLKKQLMAAKEGRERKLKEIEDLLQQISDKDEEIERLKEEIQKRLERIDELNGLIDERNLRIDDLKAQIKDKDKKIKELEMKCKGVKKPIKFKPIKGDEIDQMLADFLASFDCSVPIKKIGDGYYMFGTRKIYAKIMNGKLVIRVGGGYMIIEEFIATYADQELAKMQMLADRGDLDLETMEVRPRTTDGSFSKCYFLKY